jgi:GNAT superfamily N-acetyltransferase
VRIERATIDEIRPITEMATRFENETSHVKVDVEHSVKNYTRFYGQGNGGMIALKTDDGGIVGGLGYVIAPDLHFPRILAVETFWFVLPDFRGEGLKLMLEFEKIAEERGCDCTAMIHLSDSHPAALEKIYRRKGYELVEKHYVRRLK